MKKSLSFPQDFIFGVADADLQVVGDAMPHEIEHAELTEWDNFGHTSPGIAIDRYHRWRDDIKLMQQLGIRDYRTSISMARTMYKNGEINKEALAWYKEFFKGLKDAGINLYLTLYHWELPQHLAAIGGWTNKETVNALEKHAQIVAENLGDFVKEYFILNEPWCSSLYSYFYGFHPPAEHNLKHALLAAHNLLLSQGRIFRMLKSRDSSTKVSTVFNVESYYSYSGDQKDIQAVRYADGVFNRWFFDPVFLGQYPEDMLELYGNDMPEFPNEDLSVMKIGDKLHAMGINYYSGNIVKYDEKERFKNIAVPIRVAEKNDLGWPILTPPYYPEGLFDILTQIYNSYKHFGLKRMYITENGTAVKSKIEKDGSIHDLARIDYFQKHIHLVWKAISRGVPIEKYFAWTLMDNFEWAEGYRPESAFGLIHVDRSTLKRTPKESFFWYKNLIKTKKLSLAAKE